MKKVLFIAVLLTFVTTARAQQKAEYVRLASMIRTQDTAEFVLLGEGVNLYLLKVKIKDVLFPREKVIEIQQKEFLLSSKKTWKAIKKNFKY